MNAAVKIQENCFAANDFQLRIGLHHEVVLENDDIFGDAINIAASIQSAAAPVPFLFLNLYSILFQIIKILRLTLLRKRS
ncbi:MAG: hypothetical protein IPO98_14685 [Saprospiraceae bacterium]|nr:hypothetical protein [Saprospiraceae bacterium]